MNAFDPEELALLAAIHAEPKDDTPRLVWADWLEAHDAPEHVFIEDMTIERIEDAGD